MWSTKEKRKTLNFLQENISFIESLFMGIFGPLIYVVEIQGKSILNENVYKIVDRKQRVYSILFFLEGKL